MPEFVQILAYLIFLVALAVPLGRYMARVFADEQVFMHATLGWLERGLYRLMGVDPGAEMGWRQYAGAVVLFNLVGFVFLLVLLLAQGVLPLNPQHLAGVHWWLAVDTAASFVTNTNWQAYAGETTLSYLSQMCGLTVQNFVSAATGMAVLVALARGLSRKTKQTLGSFWVDMTRALVYVLLPLSLLLALVLIGQGVIQNVSTYVNVHTLAGAKQILPMGPAASQVAIKQLGTNGGGFFGVNSAHPFENPTPFSNFLEMLAILLLPAALPITFGRLVGHPKHGQALLIAMTTLFVVVLIAALWAEHGVDPAIGGLPFLEGKDWRFGIGNSTLWAMATTSASNGSVNAMIESMAPLTGGLAMLNIMLGEVIFGGVGSGLYGLVLFVVLTVFIAGLMVGRSPEYLGKKIEAPEIKWAVFGVLAPSIVMLALAAVAVLLPEGLAGPINKGPHGLSAILYTFATAAGNNGSAFAGLSADTPFYNVLTSLAMLIGRYAVIVPVLAIAASLGAKKISPPSPGTFPTHGGLFVGLLIGVVVIVGALTFLPALSLGPIVEHFLMLQGRVF